MFNIIDYREVMRPRKRNKIRNKYCSDGDINENPVAKRMHNLSENFSDKRDEKLIYRSTNFSKNHYRHQTQSKKETPKEGISSSKRIRMAKSLEILDKRSAFNKQLKIFVKNNQKIENLAKSDVTFSERDDLKMKESFLKTIAQKLRRGTNVNSFGKTKESQHTTKKTFDEIPLHKSRIISNPIKISDQKYLGKSEIIFNDKFISSNKSLRSKLGAIKLLVDFKGKERVIPVKIKNEINKKQFSDFNRKKNEKKQLSNDRKPDFMKSKKKYLSIKEKLKNSVMKIKESEILAPRKDQTLSNKYSQVTPKSDIFEIVKNYKMTPIA